MKRAACFVILASACTFAAADPPQRYAVVVGINDYADPAIPDLKYAESDAKAVYDTLTDPKIGRFPKQNVTLLLGTQATNDAIKLALYKLWKVDKNDLVVVFYSGHGAKESGKGYWVTQQAKAKGLPATALSSGTIRSFLDGIPSQRLLVLLDCCYAASTVRKSLTDPKTLYTEFSGKGRVTIAGSAASQEALEDPDKRSGIFSYYLLRGLRGAADANRDGFVTFAELWSYVGTRVRKASLAKGGLHEPVIITSEDGVTPNYLLTFVSRPDVGPALAALRRLFAQDKLSGAQYDLGRKVLSGPALDARATKLRKAFLDLAAGRITPEYLTMAIAAAGRDDPPHPTPPSGSNTLAVVPFDTEGGISEKDVGKMVARYLLPEFGKDFEIINQYRLQTFLDQDKLTEMELMALGTPGPRTKALRPTVSKAVKLRYVRYLVTGTISRWPGSRQLMVSAQITEWQTGRIRRNANGRQAAAKLMVSGWSELTRQLPVLAARLLGKQPPKPPTPPGMWTADLGAGVSMKFALIPAGTFRMGSPASEANRDSNETQHTVKLTKAFYMAVTEVTQGQWKALMGTTPWSGKAYAKDGADNAASYVNWNDATAFCKKLAARTGKAIRLPTEAEWEYACRAGSTTAYHFGGDASQLDRYAWYDKNAWEKGEKYAHAVGRKQPNGWGLYDMHGNVWEWCQDGYEKDFPTAMQTDPKGSATARLRVLRGGSWCRNDGHCRSADRLRYAPEYAWSYNGFRVVVSASGGLD